MIEPELALLQVQVKGRAAHAAELHQAGLRHAPEAFDAVNVSRAARELIAVVPHAVVLLVAHVHDAVVRAKAIGMNGRRQLDFAANNRLQTGFLAVRHDFGIDPPVSFVDAEDDGFTARAAPTFAADAARAEVRLVEFDLAGERRLALAMRGDGLTNQRQVAVNRVPVQPGQRGALRGSQIECKELQELPEFSTRNSCTNKSSGTNYHDLV
jgi:hypothetical protein